MRSLSICTVMFLCMVNHAISQTTYYSRNAGSGGNWNNVNSWTFNSDGSGGAAGSVPSRTDNVVVLSSHTITISATNANGSAGVTAESLGRPDVGTFTSSNIVNFYQQGNVTILSGGTITCTVRVMIDGVWQVEGTFMSTQDFINLNRLYVATGATFTTDDDLVLTGNSRTVLDNTTQSDDDIYIDHTEALLCGAGVMNIGANTGLDPAVRYWNGATIAQICSGFQVTCTPDPSCGATQTGTGGFSLNLGTLNYYKALTIQSSQVPATQANFPVLISFSDPDLRTTADGGNVQNSNGYDIIFASSNACGILTQLDHQLESYSSTGVTGTIVAWVEVPTVSSTSNTTLYMYYGSSVFTTDTSVPNVYDYSYTGVWHLNGNVLDSSPAGNNGTNSGTAAQATAKISGGRTFTATNYIQAPTSGMTVAAGTISAWARATSFSANHQYIAGHSSVPVFNDRFQLYTNDNTGLLDLGMGNNHGVRNAIFDFATATWYYVTLTWDGTNYIVYVNGTQSATGTYAGFGTLNTFFDIGNDGDAATRNEGWIGDLDEVRVSRIVRSASWIQTEYNNQNTPATFFTVGSQVTSPCGPLPIDLLNFNAYPDHETVILKWATVSEVNNDYFTVERSADAKVWEVALTRKGALNSHDLRSYTAVDDGPYHGRSYYRLKQTDLDGTSMYSKVVAVRLDLPSLNVYPNPSKGLFTLETTETLDEGQIWVTDLMGKDVNAKISWKNQLYEIDTNDLSGGIYLLNVNVDGYVRIVRLVKN